MKHKTDNLAAEDSKGRQLRWVGPSLYRMLPFGTYYGQFRRQGKLLRHSLKTKDRKLAERKLRDLLGKISSLKPGSSKTTFGEIVRQFGETELAARDLKPRARQYREYCSSNLLRTWPGLAELPVRDITRVACERWFVSRRPDISAQLLNNELGSLKMALDFAVREGFIMDSPAKFLRRARIIKKESRIPTQREFENLTKSMREVAGDDAANLIEILAYSGMRVSEAAALRWEDVDMERDTFTVTGGAAGTKNRRVRHIPLFPNLKALLERIRKARGGTPPSSEAVSKIRQCHMSIGSACKRLKLPHFSHHSLRHFFCSNAIESGIDFKVIAAWLGHSDGGMLVAKTYGHLRQQHSEAMAKKMTFTAAPAEVPSEA